MSNKKMLWSVIAYQENSDINRVINTFVGSGGQCMYILHDNDTKEDGTPKKPHYHIAVGYAKGAPDWAKFCAIMTATADEQKHGAICPSGKRSPYDPDQATVRYPEKLSAYFLHRTDHDKYQYPDNALHYTEGFCIGDYITYAKNRQSAKQVRRDELDERAENFGFFCDLAQDKQIFEYSVLCDLVRSAHPDKLGAFLQNSYAIKSYIDSMRGYAATVTVDKVRELTKEVKTLSLERDDLAKRLAELKRSYHVTLQSIIAEYAKVTGETPPAWWEMSIK